MSGPESTLTLELAAAVAGDNPATKMYLQEGGTAALVSGQGSQNLPLLALAIRLLLAVPGARDTWVRIVFPYFRSTWMGTELCSFIYGMWHLTSVLTVSWWAHRNKDADLAASADEWILHYGCLAELCRDSLGQVIWAGMRCAGHRPAPGWREWAHDLGMGRDTATWEAVGKAAGLGMRQSWMWPTLHILADTLRSAYTPLRGGEDSPLSVMPRLGLVTPLRIVRTTNGVACLIAENKNGNTPPWGALESTNGAISCLPSEGGQRIRQQFDHMTCSLSGSVITYNSSLYGDATLPLPPGDVLLDITLPAKEVAKEPTQGIATPPVSPGSQILTDVISRLNSLQLSHTDTSLRNAIVFRLSAGPLGSADYLSISRQVAALGIGPGQAQAASWRIAVAALQSLAEL